MLRVDYKTNVDLNSETNFLTYKDYGKIESLHDWRKWENNKDLTHGEWVKVWPKQEH